MHYLRTTLATDWSREVGWKSLLEQFLLKLVPEANPGYREKMHLVRSWYVEFDEDDNPWREIGLDQNDVPVIAGPSESDYGFWLDTNMKRNDFEGEAISSDEFDSKWHKSGVRVLE